MWWREYIGQSLEAPQVQELHSPWNWGCHSPCLRLLTVKAHQILLIQNVYRTSISSTTPSLGSMSRAESPSPNHGLPGNQLHPEAQEVGTAP